MATIQGIYIALFGRPADPLGLDYFNSITDGGQDLSEIDSLAGQAEYLDRFEGMNNVQIVTSIYQELFGRNPDAAGLAFFTAQLESGAQNINTIAINILDGARGEDAALVEAKIAAADQFTDAVRADPDALAAYQGQNGISFGQEFLDQIDSSDDAFTDEEVVAQVATFGDEEGQNTGDTFTLTTGLDQAGGTAGNDTFQGNFADLNGFDNLQGRGGNDTLNLFSDNSDNVAVPNTATVQGIETVNINRTVGNDNDGSVDASGFEGATAIWQINDAGLVNNVSQGTTVGFRDVAVALGATETVTYVDGAVSASIAVDNVANNSVVFVDETTDGDLTSVTVSGDVAGAGAVGVNVAGTTTAVETINLALTSNGTVTLTVDNAVLTTVNASASTGNLGINASAITALETITTGTGNDAVTVSLAGENLTVNSGAGNDTVTVTLDSVALAADASKATIALGAGNDTLVITEGGAAGGNLADDANTAAEITNSLVSVSGFVRGEDTIDLPFAFSAFDEQGGVGGVQAALDGADTLEEAVANLRASAVVEAQFNLNGNLYIFDDNAGAVNDTLIELVGVNSLLTQQDVLA